MLTLHEVLISYIPSYNIGTCSRTCWRYPAGRKRGPSRRTTKRQTRHRQSWRHEPSAGHGHRHPHALWMISWSVKMTLGHRHHLAHCPLVMSRKLWYQLGPSCSRAWWTPSRQGWCTWRRQSSKSNTAVWQRWRRPSAWRCSSRLLRIILSRLHPATRHRLLGLPVLHCPPGATEQAQVALLADIIVLVHNTTQNSSMWTSMTLWRTTQIFMFFSCNTPTVHPELNFAPRKRKQLLTEMEWISAFNTYTALYLEKYPHALNAILSYSSTVQQIMTAGGDWRNYDTRYRQDREVTHCSWHTLRPNLELQAYRRTNMQSFRSTTTNSFQRSTNQRQTGTPHGYCFAFHSPKAVCTRSPLQYLHTCHICNSRHPAYKCPSTSNKQIESDTPRETV